MIYFNKLNLIGENTVVKNSYVAINPGDTTSHGEMPQVILYHGTSTYRLKSIQRENCLRVSQPGEPKVSLTTERGVAQYFAYNMVFVDRHDHPDEQSHPVILVLDGDGLDELLYDLEPFSDLIWSEGKCDWEKEIACWDDIDPLDEVLIGTDLLPEECFDRWVSAVAARKRQSIRLITPGLGQTMIAEIAPSVVSSLR